MTHHDCPRETVPSRNALRGANRPPTRDSMLDDSLPTSTRRQRTSLWTGLYLRLFDGAEDDDRPDTRSRGRDDAASRRTEGE